MSPHAILPFESEQMTNNPRNSEDFLEHPNLSDWRPKPAVVGTNRVLDATQSRNIVGSPHLERAGENELYDLICVGFGPASLAIAVALHDRHESLISRGIYAPAPKVLFLEKQKQFRWHLGMLLPSAKMQITFLKDLATLRNPRSHFTFVNYLHKHDRLVAFTNLDTFLPSRIEFEDYLRWCAAHFDGNGRDSGVVDYGHEVVSIEPDSTSKGQTSSFAVVSRETYTGETFKRRARNVVIAAGGSPNIPHVFPRHHPRIIHSSQFSYTMSRFLPERNESYRVAVIGGGQSAAEIFDQLHTAYPNSKSTLFIRESALKPSDDSPFVNEVFNPEKVDSFYSRNEQVRRKAINENKTTNYGVVRLELLEKIYESLYMQRLAHGNDETVWPHTISPYSQVVRVQDTRTGVVLHIQRPSTADDHAIETTELEFDAVILGTGYTRNAYEHLLAPLQHLAPSQPPNKTSGVNGIDVTKPAKIWHTQRNYSVACREGAVSGDCGIWLQGCCEATHGLADSLLSILSVRSGELVESIFGPVSRSTADANGRGPQPEISL